MRVRLLKDYKQFRHGQIIIVSESKAELLIKAGFAIKSVDMTDQDMRTK